MQAYLHIVRTPELVIEGDVLPQGEQLVLTFEDRGQVVRCAVEDLNLRLFRAYEERAAHAINQKLGPP